MNHELEGAVNDVMARSGGLRSARVHYGRRSGISIERGYLVMAVACCDGGGKAVHGYSKCKEEGEHATENRWRTR